MTTRRSFLKFIPLSLGALTVLPNLFAETLALIEESDATANALGYKHDAATVDAKKYPQYKAGQTCATCALYTGKAGAESGPCMALGNKLVAAKGWCMVYAQKV